MKKHGIITFKNTNSAGFSSDYLTVASTLKDCLAMELLPYIDTANTWFNPTFDFNENKAIDQTINPWDWWFVQPKIPLTADVHCVECNRLHIKHNPMTFMQQKEIVELAELAEVYLKPKQLIMDKVNALYNSFLKGKRVLAVVARGTEMNYGHLNYPKYQSNDWVAHVSNYLAQCPDIELIYLISEDKSVIEIVSKHFPNVYFLSDVFRQTIQEVRDARDKKPWWLISPENNPNHTRRLGEEMLIQTYLGARCDYFLGNCSGITNLVQFLNKAQFKKAVVI